MARKKPAPKLTDADWLKSEDPKALAKVAIDSSRATDRVMRLFVAAFWGWQAESLHAVEAREGLRSRAAMIEEWGESGVAPNTESDYNAMSVVGQTSDARWAVKTTARAPGTWGKMGVPAVKQAVLLVRDIFGNPFRPVAFDKSWLTSTVIAIALGMYESRDFSAMPILADALQDAGCENDDILTHCRGSGPHVRGCWVVDHVLGKS